jgi:hypothetical protein
MPRIIAIAAGALILYQWAVARPLWLDEEMLAINVRERGLLDLGGRLSLGQAAPYGWLVLERLAYATFGSGERSMRVLPLAFGLAAIAAAVWIGHRWMRSISACALVLTIGVAQWLTYSYVELKHYSADVCFGLLLPALAAWSLETDRILVWWLVAALAQFVANGAIFVAPACALLIVIATWRDRSTRAAMVAAAPGVIWLALFAVNYVLALRPAQTSPFLQTFWQLEFPPREAGILGIIRWFGARLAPFATKPGGTDAGVLLWVAAAGGFAAACGGRRRLLALAFALVPVSAMALSTAHVVPFFERLTLWVMPAMFVGVALLGDADPGWPTYLRGAAIAAALVIAADVVYVGLDDLRARPKETHHRLDDRSAVRWLAAREQPGDVWVTTRLALPAIWWYAPDVRLEADTMPVASGFSRTILEVGYTEPGPECDRAAFHGALDGKRRALVFFGFRFDDVPTHFDDLLLRKLTERGHIVADRGFGKVSRVVIVDLDLRSRRDDVPSALGCISAQPARRW